MKNLYLIAAAFVFTTTSCNKTDAVNPLAEDTGCIERVLVPVNAHSINSADVIVVNKIFSNNSIDNTKYRYYQYIHDSIQTFYAPFAKFDSKTVKVDQYSNGLRIFGEDMLFNFKDDILSFKNGDPTKGTKLNTVSSITLGQLRKLFIDNIEQFDYKGNQYKDSCFKAEFGYFNLNSGVSNATENLMKAWRITLKNSVYPSEYPIAYYQDISGKLIYYSNGIETFK